MMVRRGKGAERGSRRVREGKTANRKTSSGIDHHHLYVWTTMASRVMTWSQKQEQARWLSRICHLLRKSTEAAQLCWNQNGNRQGGDHGQGHLQATILHT